MEGDVAVGGAHDRSARLQAQEPHRTSLLRVRPDSELIFFSVLFSLSVRVCYNTVILYLCSR